MKSIATNHRFLLITGILVLFRVMHLSNDIDNPHAWRQYDTKQYIEGYYYDDVPFLEPIVCWMGGHKTLILEFPLPEYLVAQLYKVFGPHVIVARIFFMVFFILAMLYFYKSLRLVFDNWVPEIATLVAGLMPLSIYYSRAVHIDFFAIAFAMGTLYFTMKSIREQTLHYIFIAMFLSSIAFLTKAPYVFYLALPILLFAYHEKQLIWILKSSVLFVVPVALFVIWIKYSKFVNLKSPEWEIIPNFNRFTEMWYWYFGTWQQRMLPEKWILIGTRIYEEVLGISGLILMLIGLIFYKKNKSYYWSIALLIGTILYVCIFFNLNVIHNYYQLPFILCCAPLIALGVQWIIDKSSQNSSTKLLLPVVLIGVVISESVSYSEVNYYFVHDDVDKVAEEIRKFSTHDDLIVVSYGGLTPQCPLVLQPAGRYGWSIPVKDLSPEQLHYLWKESGATKLALVYGGYMEGELRYFYEAMSNKKSILINNEGYVLYMCDLNFTPPGN